MDSENSTHEENSIDFGYECDLHFFHPKDTKDVILEFIEQAKNKRLQKIRLVHGKGKSVKKKMAYKILAEHPAVESFHDDSHNWGATIIVIKT